MLLLLLLPTLAVAQPSSSQVTKDFMKNGVTKVDIIKTTKEWDSKKSKYYWKVTLNTTLPVDPAEVDGLKGVTMIRHVVANYDCGGSCVKTFSGLVYSEYKGINLSTPAIAELMTMLKTTAATKPELLVRSTSSKVGYDSFKIEEPAFEWVNPRTLSFRALLYYRDQVSYTEVASFEVPIKVFLKRSAIAAPWQLDGAEENFEARKELTRGIATEQTANSSGTSSGSTTNEGTTSATEQGTASVMFGIGDKVMVEERGKWYPSTILKVEGSKYFIHYEGYSDFYDTWVGPERVKNQ